MVKLWKNTETGQRGLAGELIGSLLAKKLEILVPECAIVVISQEWSSAIAGLPSAADMAKNVGENFGSRLLTGGFSTWPTGMSLDDQQLLHATSILAFDAMIQNPDRQPSRPNMLSAGSEIYAIDHESAFAFLYQIGGKPDPWRRSAFSDILVNHAFYGAIRERGLDLAPFEAALEGIDDPTLHRMESEVPLAWRGDWVGTIIEHVRLVRDHRQDFVHAVREVMS